MKASKIVRAFYNDDDILLSAVKTIRENNYHIEEVYTPFPVHGLDKVPGKWRTCEIQVPKGRHQYSIEIPDKDKAVLTRFILY